MSESHRPCRHVAVIDIGKSNAKLAWVDAHEACELQVWQQPNRMKHTAPYAHFDIESLWQFLLDSLGEMQKRVAVEALSVTTHGAAMVALNHRGELALPVLDYEHAGPDELAADYEQVRPAFECSGSPRLPGGLNLGAQLYWQAHRFPKLWARVRHLVTYPQYWAWRLSGVMCNEASSLGCHTDLWVPADRRYSDLVSDQGWLELMPPLRSAFDCLGPVLPGISQVTGLHCNVPVFAGLHDSNASLLPHLMYDSGPFSVVSTGTWVIVMAMQAEPRVLDPARDTLMNVNALGDPVPSARFMGGREFEQAMAGHGFDTGTAAMGRVLERSIMLLPAVQPGSGPFAGQAARWTQAPDSLADTERSMVVSLYLACMTHTCLELIGARGPIIVEGAFGQNPAYLRALAGLQERPVRVATGVTGTSVGAALLALPEPTHQEVPKGRYFGGSTAHTDKASSTRTRRSTESERVVSQDDGLEYLLRGYGQRWQQLAARAISR